MQERVKSEDIKKYIDQLADDEYQMLMDDMKIIREKVLQMPLSVLSVKTQMYPSYLHRVETAEINTSVKKLIVMLDALGLKLKIESKEGETFEIMKRSLEQLKHMREQLKEK